MKLNLKFKPVDSEPQAQFGHVACGGGEILYYTLTPRSGGWCVEVIDDRPIDECVSQHETKEEAIEALRQRVFALLVESADEPIRWNPVHDDGFVEILAEHCGFDLVIRPNSGAEGKDVIVTVTWSADPSFTWSRTFDTEKQAKQAARRAVKAFLSGREPGQRGGSRRGAGNRHKGAHKQAVTIEDWAWDLIVKAASNEGIDPGEIAGRILENALKTK